MPLMIVWERLSIKDGMSSGRILLIIFPQSSLNWPSSYRNKPVPLFWRKANKTSIYFWKAICHEILGVIHWRLYFKIGTFNSVIISFSWLDYFLLVNIQSYTCTFIKTSSINSHKPYSPFLFFFIFFFFFFFELVDEPIEDMSLVASVNVLPFSLFVFPQSSKMLFIVLWHLSLLKISLLFTFPKSTCYLTCEHIPPNSVWLMWTLLLP